MNLNYKESGVDINEKDKLLSNIAPFVSVPNNVVLNKLGSFASLIDINPVKEYKDPVLTFKIEEPGTKQKLAWQNNRLSSVGYDLINHLVNDILVMGSKPLVAQDLIVCGKLEEKAISSLIASMKFACELNDCYLVGGETSEQPGVVDSEAHILGAAMIGISERSNVIDGSKIERGNKIIGLASRGVHTNGYSLIRKMIELEPSIKYEMIERKTFLDHVLTPHYSYYFVLKDYLKLKVFNGLAHVTGGGIQSNLDRIIPDGLTAKVDFDSLEIPAIFKFIQDRSGNSTEDMFRTFNMGVGMIAVMDKEKVKDIESINREIDVFEIGEIV